MKSYINYETHPDSFKAYHSLGPWKIEKYATPIIVKFVYFGEKFRRFMAENCGYQKHHNGKTYAAGNRKQSRRTRVNNNYIQLSSESHNHKFRWKIEKCPVEF